uniref:XPG N-terminal domain-containing protein n=1 Tax=Clastoptera arizonana TaxID=38151 RepID=A0A1B6DNA6_9HEMI
MGVRGLTTYIKENRKALLIDYKLHNCFIVIDGYSIATNLFISLNSETAFGGNYDVYAWHVRNFFKLLKKCRIKPIVIFDGGYESRKLRTICTRMKNKVLSANIVSLNSSVQNFPLFMRQVFREILIEMEIPFAQCDFEADFEIAAIARELKCPVLSYDSDFYIFDVLYIPYPSLSFTARPLFTTLETRSQNKYYLKCKIYNIDHFLKSIGGLDKSMLPLLAALLGNDYVERCEFKPFIQHLVKVPKAKKNNTSKLLINALLNWMRNETSESAICKILSRMKKKRRRLIAFKLNCVIKGYTKQCSVLDTYFDIKTVKNEVDDLDVEYIISRAEQLDISEEEDDNKSCDSNDSVCSDILNYSDEEEESSLENDSGLGDSIKIENGYDSANIITDPESLNDVEIPEWLLDSSRRGNIHSSIFDILTLRVYFFPIQVEDYSNSHSHGLSLPILKVIIGLLLGDNQRIRYYARNHLGKLEWFSIDSEARTKSVKFPGLEFVNRISTPDKVKIILETLDLDIDLKLFPANWHIAILSILYWLKNMSEPVATFNHLHTIVMCIIALQVIPSEIGNFGTNQAFCKKYGKFLRKAKHETVELKSVNNESESNNDINLENYEQNIDLCADNTKIEKNSTNFDTVTLAASILNYLNIVTKEDCIFIHECFLPFYNLNDKIERKPNLFNIKTIHSFAQLQSCIHHIIILNSILGLPLEQCFVSKFYSGMFAYNIITELDKKRDVYQFIQNFFKLSPSLLNLFHAIVNSCIKMLPPNHLNNSLAKPKRRKRKKDKTIVNNIDEIVSYEKDEEDFIDENNKYSLLRFY